MEWLGLCVGLLGLRVESEGVLVGCKSVSAIVLSRSEMEVNSKSFMSAAVAV